MADFTGIGVDSFLPGGVYETSPPIGNRYFSTESLPETEGRRAG
jgi:hypothetical protein